VWVLRQLWIGAQKLLRRQKADEEIGDEVDSFFAETKADFQTRGFSAEEAERAARLALGSRTALREEVRSYGWENVLDGMVKDLRYGLRRLRNAPSFTLVSIGTLALGIGATSAIFSVINGVLLKPLPYENPEQLVAVWMADQHLNISDLNMAPSVYFTMRDEQRAFSANSMFTTGNTTVSRKTHPEEVQAVFATHELLAVLGTAPQFGRAFTSKDDDSDSERTVMLSDGYWHSHFGGDRGILGRQITVEGNRVTVIGVLPPSFEFMDQRTDLLLPLRFKRSSVTLGNFSYMDVARLRPGMTIAGASADLARILRLTGERFPPPPGYTTKMFQDSHIVPNLRSLRNDIVGDIGNTLWLLMTTIGMVLLIACANVANLLLVRTDARQGELAVRAALGASTTRIARELLFESVLLGVMAGALGLGLCWAALKLLVASDLVHLPRSGNIGIDGWVLAFTSVLSIGFSICLGLIPVLRYVRPGIHKALRSSGRSMSQSKPRQQARGLLVVVQIALALMLLITSGLMIRTFRNLHNVDPGFTNPRQLQTIRVGIPDEIVKEPEAVIHTEQAMLDRVAAINGVVSASIISSVPMGGGESNDPVYAADKTYREGSIAAIRRFKFVAPGYFSTVGQRLIAGHDLTWSDIYNGGPVAIVSENTAREIWGTPMAAVGKHIRTNDKDDWREVIGVVANEYADGVDKQPPTIVYWPLLAKNFDGDATSVARYVSFVLRTPRAGSSSLQKECQNAIWSILSDLPLVKSDTLETLYKRSLARTSFTLLLLAVAGSMALILALVGIYGVVSYTVSLRTREIGIRLALGAPVANVTSAFVRSSLLLSVAGCACGLAAAFALTPPMKSLLFLVSPSDPLTYTVMSAGLIATAAIASYFPARRATKIDPIVTLRAE
jgi:putative ABC transport system permease protein